MGLEGEVVSLRGNRCAEPSSFLPEGLTVVPLPFFLFGCPSLLLRCYWGTSYKYTMICPRVGAGFALFDSACLSGVGFFSLTLFLTIYWLYYTVLLYYTILYRTIPYHTIPMYTVLHRYYIIITIVPYTLVYTIAYTKIHHKYYDKGVLLAGRHRRVRRRQNAMSLSWAQSIQ